MELGMARLLEKQYPALQEAQMGEELAGIE